MKFKAIYFLLMLVSVFSIFRCEEGTINEIIENNEPILLSCDYFNQDTSRTLIDYPNKLVDYRISCQARVSVDLIIQPGVVIEFESNSGLNVSESGSISAVGSVDKPILLTGVDKIAGSWKGVLIDSEDVKNKLSNLTIDYAGGSPFNSNGDLGSLIMWAGFKVSIDHCTFSNSAAAGLNLSYNQGDFLSFSNNVFVNNKQPIYALARYIDDFDSTSSYNGNANDYVEIGCSSPPEGNNTWRKIDVPYLVTPTNFGISKSISLIDGSNLIIEAGNVIKFSTGTQIFAGSGSSLKAIGTQDDPIILQGEDNAPGAWAGVGFSFTQSVNNRLEYVNIKHTGSEYDNQYTAIYMWADPNLTVTNCTFSDNEGCIFYNAGDNFIQSNNDFGGVSIEYIFCE